MSRRDWTRLVLAAIVVLIMVLASGGMGFAAGWYLKPQPTPSPTPPSTELEQRFRIVWEAWDILQRDFHRQGPLDEQKMVRGAVDGMVRSLGDPYTVFVEPVQAKIFDQDLEGSFEGIGATVDLVDGYLVIVEPLPDSPALKAGLRPGDVVLEVDGKPLKDVELMQAIALIRGPKGTPVRLLIQRKGEAQPFEVSVVRQKIDLPTVSFRMLDKGIAYVRLTEFNSQATARLENALKGLMAQNPTGLVLDLRGNPGGYLHIAVQVASEFIREGPIVTESDRNGKVTEHNAQGQGLALDVPLVVLVDAGSASASEIVAGAIQDTGRGTLIGRQTLGKGSAQVAHTLSDGSSLRVTVTRWYTPKGHQLDGKGLTPDIVVPLDPSQPADKDAVLERAIQFLTTPADRPQARGT